jgi:homoserine kinase
LEQPFDELTLTKIPEPVINIVHRDEYDLPTDPKRNVAGVALSALMDAAEVKHGFEVEITKGIKPGSGIGSSAASACGVVVAANELIGGRFSKTELVGLAMEGEMVASGARHADNLAPCIFGGFTLVRSVEPLDIVSISFPPLFATILHPQIEIKTSEARNILPTEISLKKAVVNWSNLGSLVAALANGDHDLMARSLVDQIIEPVRKSLIPLFDEVKAAALEAGALGGGISGSGPAIFMLSRSRGDAEHVETAFTEVYRTSGIEFNTYVSPINASGVRVV